MHAELPRFAGSEQHALDDKGRLIVPARFRERLGPQFVLTIAHPDPCLALYPTATWIEFCGRVEAIQPKDDRYRRYVRYIFAHSEEVSCDVQGRVVVPALLRAYAGIKRQVVSVGLLTRIEIWARERYAFETPPEGEVPGFMAELGL
ncbi:MAG TPA: division/cell wall cluster transcriptional repressor MraZ [Candidatus Babeliales bacterium]|nr:division/cell wall cluster transcriptional repressor MraZ [Candidatus Babeliales bacterium]